MTSISQQARAFRVTERRRRIARDVARAGSLVSAAMLVLGLTSIGHHTAAAAVNAGALQVLVPPGTPAAGQPLASGSPATAIAFTVPAGAACTGDSASDNYRIHSFMVPAGVDPGTITYDSGGPTPQADGAAFRLPLFSTNGTPFVNALTGVKTSPTSGGLVAGYPAMSFAALVDVNLPAGVYNVGYACVLAPPAVAPTLDKWWSVQLTFDASKNWTASAPPVSTTTTLATTTTAAGGSTTTARSTTTTVKSTSTSVGSSSTTTVAGGTTTTLRLGSGAGVFSGGGTSSGTGSSGGSLVVTGSSPAVLLMWAFLLLVFGRMAILFARPVRVIPPDAR